MVIRFMMTPTGKLKLLVVDDDPNSLQMLRRTFYNDYDLFCASSGIEALNILAENRDMAVTISDQNMPEMLGTELFNQMAIDYPNTIRILFTASPNAADIIRTVNSSQAFRYLAKPCNISALRDAVQQGMDMYTLLTNRTQALENQLASVEARYRLIFESAVEGIFQATVDGRYILANPMLAKIYGYDSADELTASVTNLNEELYVSPSRRAELMAMLKEHGSVTNFESEVLRRDGRVIWVSENIRTMITDEGELIGFEGTVQNITARKRAEDESQLLQKLTMAISMAQDFRSALQTVLEQICEFTEWKLGEVWIPVLGSDLLACSPAWYSGLRDSERFRQISEKMTFPKGVGFPGRVWYSQRPEWLWDIQNETELAFPRKFCSLELGLRAALGIPILDKGDVMAVMVFFMTKPKDADQNLVGVISAIATQLGSLMQRKRDEEEIRLMNREIVLARDQALEASRAKSTFVANMSHELRTPLNAILGYSEMLQEDAEELGLTTLKEDLQKIHQAGRHLLELINDILDLSKIEAGKMELKPEKLDIRDVITDVVSTIHPLLTKNQNQIIVECPEDIGNIYADVIRLRQALFNLLGNACKFTQAGVVKLRVWQEFDIHGNFYFFEVSDTGIGIAPEVQQYLFQSFMQADGSTTRQYGGTGLGLAISQRLCNIMGGRISVKSELGIGSVFTICLPAKLEKRHQTVSQNISPFKITHSDHSISSASSSNADNPNGSYSTRNNLIDDDSNDITVSHLLKNVNHKTRHLMESLGLSRTEVNGDDSREYFSKDHHSEKINGEKTNSSVRILFIDSNPITHQVFSNYLAVSKGFLCSVYSIDDAYQLALETEPQVIVMNVYPLKQEQCHLLQQIYQHPRLQSIPIFSLAINHQKKTGYLLNINEWLILPTNTTEVSHMLSHYRASYLLAHGQTMTDICTVLVISSNQTIEAALSPLLETNNCHGIIANDAEGAISLLAVMRPNLLLIDFSQPHHDYWELVHKLRTKSFNSADYSNLPVVGLLDSQVWCKTDITEPSNYEQKTDNSISNGLDYDSLFKNLLTRLYQTKNVTHYK
ncbi:MAG: ATP-binding protein [Pseudanabaenaceae cyanobacterium]|jgi:PAS domain S-box-containing protein